MPLFFEFKLRMHGWADAVLGGNGCFVNLTASYLTDALGDLVRAVRIALLGEDSGCSWDAEPREYRWYFSRNGDSISVLVLTFDDVYAHLTREEGTVLFNATAPAVDVARTFEHAARDVLSKFGMDGYMDRWIEHPFPLADLDDLRSTIENERQR